MPGLLLLVAWLASVVLAWRQRSQRLLALDGVLLAALLLGWASISPDLRRGVDLPAPLVVGHRHVADRRHGLERAHLVGRLLAPSGTTRLRRARRRRPRRRLPRVHGGQRRRRGPAARAERRAGLARPPDRSLPRRSRGGRRRPRRPLRRVVGGSALPRHVRLRAARRARAGRLRRRRRPLERRRRGGASSRAGGRGHRAAPGRGRAGDRRLVPPARSSVASPTPTCVHRRRCASTSGCADEVLRLGRALDLPELEQFEAQLFATANRTDLPATIASRVIRMAEIGLPAAVFVSVP